MSNPPKETHHNNHQGNPTQMVTHHKVAAFSGPIPPPDVLAKYDELKSGLAERIVKMAEDQGNHRRSLEAKTLDAQIRHTKARDLEAKMGQIFAFILAIFTIIVGAYLVIHDYQISGTIFGGMGLVSIVVAFIYGTKKENR